MPGLTVSEKIFNKKPDNFMKEHITQLLIQQYTNSYKTETSATIVAFNFYSDHALIITSNKEGEIYLYRKMEYESMFSDSLSTSLTIIKIFYPLIGKGG